MFKDGLKNIKNNYLKDAIKCLCFGIMYLFMFLVFAYQVWNDTQILFSIIMAVIFLGLTILYLYNFLKCAYFFFYPTKSDICKICSSINDALDEIEATALYDDKRLIVSQRFIVSKKDCRDLFLLDDILGIYVRVHKTNFVIDKYTIVIADKFDRSANFDYSPKQKEIMEQVLLILTSKCKHAKVGYSQETLDYIKNNTIKL